MKNIFLIIIISILCFGSQAQNNTNSKSNEGINIVKFNPLSLAFGKLSLGYERAFENNNSFTLQLGIPVKATISEGLHDIIDVENLDINSIEFNGFSIRPAYRMYLKKENIFKGFYFEPSIKYQKTKGFIDGIYNDDGEKHDSEVDIDINTFGVGAQLGIQFLISQIICFDLFLIGPEINFGNIDIKYKDISGNADLYDVEIDIVEYTDDTPYFDNAKIIVDEREGTVTITSKDQLMPGFRAGFSIGIRF